MDPLRRRISGFALIGVLMLGLPVPTLAQSVTTGAISGTVSDAQSGSPVADVKVEAVSGSGSRSTTTDSRGYFTLQALQPDTYTVSFQAKGYLPVSTPGVTVQQQFTVSLNTKIAKTDLKTIANVSARSSGNLVQPNVTSDVYTVSGAHLNALTGGNNLGKTLYQYAQGVPGVTASGFEGQPRIHGGSITDTAYEFDGIPIKDRMTGFFTTNLSNLGIGNIQIYTGGLSAQDSAGGLGVINTVAKTGSYPSTLQVTYGSAFDSSKLVDLTAEYSGATLDRRFTWYMGIATTNANNNYASGAFYPALIVEGLNGPGPVKTTDIVGNFHYRPNAKDDFQFLIQNGLGDFIFDYGMQRKPGDPVPLTAVPCPGYVANSATPTGASGGTAPNGQACPIGLYFGTASTQNGGGNIWHHYSGIGKIQWNHLINDHSFISARIAENFNQYIFDQPIVEANLPQYENNADFQVSPTCPLLPYQPNTPIQSSGPGGTGAVCAQQQNWFNTGYYGDRRSNMWLSGLDYTNDLSDTTRLKVGVSEEYDNNINNSYFSFYMNGDGSWPGVNSLSSYPDHILSAYIDPSFRKGKWLISPGLLFQRMNYDYPGGPFSSAIWNPTFSAAYTAGTHDVIRGSFTDSNTFIGTSYVWRVGSSIYNPGINTFSASPTLMHSMDMQWEHQFDSRTSMKVGPYFWKSSNVFYLYKPIKSINPSTGHVTYYPTQPANGAFRQSFGVELGVSHEDNRPVGTSWWLATTLDNYWTNLTSGLTSSFNAAALPPFRPHIRNTGNALISGSLSADIHKDQFHLIPLVYYQGPSPYNIANCGGSCTSSTTNVMQPELWSSGYFRVNMTALMNFGPGKRYTLGIQGTNILNNTNDVTPCAVSTLASSPALGAGCSPFWPAGSQPGVPNSGFTYQNYSQTPAQYLLFVSTKL